MNNQWSICVDLKMLYFSWTTKWIHQASLFYVFMGQQGKATTLDKKCWSTRNTRKVGEENIIRESLV